MAPSFETNIDSGYASENVESKPYRFLNQYHSQPTKLRVIHVGAGAAGLLLAYKIQKQFKHFELVLYDKNAGIGGTWFENRYPGCACDIPAHNYTYAFEPNPNWSSYYASAPEVKKYFEDFATKYDLHRYIKLNSRIVGATWIEEKGIYEVEIESEGKRIQDWCNVLINGTGFANRVRWPDIPGLHDFKGTLVHTADWDPSLSYKDKTVSLIGNGSASIQLLPHLQKEAKHIDNYIRSPTWISQPFGLSHLENTLPDKEKIVPGTQYYYSEEEKRKFREDPEFHLKYRRDLEIMLNEGFDVFLKDSPQSKAAEETIKAEMFRRIGPGHEKLKERLIPSWPPGCRRLTPGDGYLEALTQNNVQVVYEDIVKIVPEGVVTADGRLYKADILICATGFTLPITPPFEIRGVDGVNMADEWNPIPIVYLGFAVPKFPNYFLYNGPRGNWASGALLAVYEVEVDYILKCVKRIQDENIRAFEVKREPIDQLYEHLESWYPTAVWSASCRSWFKNHSIDGKLWAWTGSGLHYMKTIRDVKFEDYNIRSRFKNKWAYLGNGRTEIETLHQTEKLAPYIRNSDTPWELE